MNIEQLRELIWARRFNECIDASRTFLQKEPEHYEAWYILAECLKQQTQYAPALAASIKVLNHIPNQLYAAAVLVDCCVQLGLPDVALPYLERLIFADKPHELVVHATHYYNLGFVDESFRRMHVILERFPNDDFATHMLGMMQMRCGDVTTGMQNYQRLVSRSFHVQYRADMQQRGWDFSRSWEGESVEGKTVLIIPYGGVGDYIQFIRYTRQLKQLGAVRIKVFLPNPRLRGLIESVTGIDEVLDDLTDCLFDWWTDPFRLCVYLQPKVGYLPTLRYINPPTSILAEQTLAQIKSKAQGRRCIGLNWHSDMTGAAIRCVPLSFLFPLFTINDVYWVILQRGDALAELDCWGFSEQYSVISEQATFDDTAAIVDDLEAVITIDCYMLHLASALGKKVYFMAGRALDWRHMNEETQSVWYPNTELMRQPKLGDWQSVIRNIVLKLKA